MGTLDVGDDVVLLLLVDVGLWRRALDSDILLLSVDSVEDLLKDRNLVRVNLVRIFDEALAHTSCRGALLPITRSW